MNEIPLFKVYMNEQVGKMVENTLLSGMITQSHKVEEFENKLKEYFNHPYVLTLNSATSGLTLAYRLLNLQPTEKVISSPLTCFATTCATLANTKNIVWADTDLETCNINLESVKKLLSHETRILTIVHWGGNPVNLDIIEELKIYARNTYNINLEIIEDCAHAFGSEWNGKKIGTHGNICVFSLQAIKHLTTGDGGLILLPNKELYKRAKLLRWYGIDREHRSKPGTDFRLESDIQEWGYKFHMNDICATIGLANLPDIPKIIEKCRENAVWFDKNICTKNIHIFKRNTKSNPSFWIYTIRVKHGLKPFFLDYMKNNGIVVSQVHGRNDKHSCVSFLSTPLPNLDLLEKEIVSIPCGWWVTENDRNRILKRILDFDDMYTPKITLITEKYFNEYILLLSEMNSFLGNNPTFTDEMLSQIYILTINNEIISSGKLYIENKIYEPIGHIEDIVTKKSKRGFGHGKTIVKHLSNVALEKGCYKIVLNAKNELRYFYEQCGYESTGIFFTKRK